MEKTTKRGRGRPKDSGAYSEDLHMRMSPEDLARLEALRAKAGDSTTTATVRRLIREAAEREGV